MERKSKSDDKTMPAKRYAYPNIYYLLVIYAALSLIVVLIFPFEASWESVLGAGIVSLSVLAVSLVAGPIGNPKTIEHQWLKDAAASSFVTMFVLTTAGAAFASLNALPWQVAGFATIGVTTIDFLGKLIIAKKRAS